MKKLFVYTFLFLQCGISINARTPWDYVNGLRERSRSRETAYLLGIQITRYSRDELLEIGERMTNNIMLDALDGIPAEVRRTS